MKTMQGVHYHYGGADQHLSVLLGTSPPPPLPNMFKYINTFFLMMWLILKGVFEIRKSFKDVKTFIFMQKLSCEVLIFLKTHA